MKNYADLGGCYPPKPKAEADNTLLDLHNSSYHTQPHPIIAKYVLNGIMLLNGIIFSSESVGRNFQCKWIFWFN